MRKLLLIVPQLLLIGLAWGQVDYQTQIQTIFNANCTSCHINGGAYQQGLDLSSYDSLMAGSNNGAVIVPGDYANSLLWQKVNSGTMPPGNNPDLGAGEINLIAQWIDEGALENPVYAGPVWHVATTGSDETGNGSEANPFATIQAGIDAASDGDTVLVAAGGYSADLENICKNIYLIGEDRETTFYSNNLGLYSFNSSQHCGGVIENSYLYVENFTIEGKVQTLGVEIVGLENVHIISYTPQSLRLLTPNGDVIINNSIVEYYGEGNAIWILGAISTTINHSTIIVHDSNNGIINLYGATNSIETISSSIFWGDTSLFSENSNFSNLSVMYSNIEGGWDGTGNIDANPLFCNADSSDYTLAENSPCVGTGENGDNMGALGVGCEALILAPVLSDIDDQQIEEDGSVTLAISATSAMGLDMTFLVYSDTSDVIVSLDNTTLTAEPEPDWYGTANISVMVTDENGLSDTTDFALTVTPVNDSPEAFSVVYPTVSDTFSTHVDSDTAIVFNWEESYDVDSDVTYTLTIELEFFGNTYTDVHENISDTTISISSNSLDALLNVTSQDIATFTFYVNSSDGEYMVASDVGEFVLFRAALGVNEGLSVPVVYALHQNYPNPFNPITTLRYDLPENSYVNVTVYDMLGREIRTLVNTTQDAGFKLVIWDATNDYGKPVSAGVYLYQIQAGKFVQTKKMVLLK